VRFLLLLHGDETAEAAMSVDDRRAVMSAHAAYAATLEEAGVFVIGEPLQPSAVGAVVRRDGPTGDVSITDGPFAETKEQLGGYYLIEAKDADEAIAIAGRIPGAKHGSIEVRPVFSAADYEG
jgi:hypothetical protein